MAAFDFENIQLHTIFFPLFTDLACMYKLLYRVEGGLLAIVSCVSSYLREQGRNLVTEDEGGKGDAVSFVQVMLF